MATTCKLIAKTVLGSDAASIEFTSIPGTYTDLLLVFSIRSSRNTGTESGVYITLNGSTSNLSYQFLAGDGSNTASGSGSTGLCGVTSQATDTSSTFGNGEIYIPNYAGSTNKSFSSTSVRENNATSGSIYAFAGLWSNTAAITSIKINAESGSVNLVTNSSAYLYGITKA